MRKKCALEDRGSASSEGGGSGGVVNTSEDELTGLQLGLALGRQGGLGGHGPRSQAEHGTNAVPQEAGEVSLETKT